MVNEIEGGLYMINPVSALRGRVIEKCGTIGNFAHEMNWSGRKASYVTTGRQVLTIKEAEKCAEVLGIDNVEDFMRIFYPMLSIRWTKKGA